jgi:MFS family permease
VQLGVLAALAWWFARPRGDESGVAPEDGGARGAEGVRLAQRAFVERWRWRSADSSSACLATLAYFRGTPHRRHGGARALVARVRSRARDPARAPGRHGVPSRAARPRDDGSISDNGLFVAGLVVGAACAAAAAGELRWRKRERRRARALALVGGIAMGFGALIASGCTIGALLSGVMAFSLHGWVFALGLVAGAWAAVRLAP